MKWKLLSRSSFQISGSRTTISSITSSAVPATSARPLEPNPYTAPSGGVMQVAIGAAPRQPKQPANSPKKTRFRGAIHRGTGADSTIARSTHRMEIDEHAFVPPELSPSMLRALTLPTDCVPYGTTSELFTSVRQAFVDHGFTEAVAVPASFFVLARGSRTSFQRPRASRSPGTGLRRSCCFNCLRAWFATPSRSGKLTDPLGAPCRWTSN